MLDKLRSRIVHLGPSLLSVPVKLTPFALKRQVLEQVLSWQFRQALDDGELEFLEGRWLSIHVRDIDLQWFTSVVNGKLVVSQNAQADVSFSADASDLLEQMPKALRMMLLQLADFVEAGMKTAPETKQTSVGEPC